METETERVVPEFDRDKLFSKLTKILALTQSPVEGEAQLAAQRLQELLTKYNLDMADLERKGAKGSAVGSKGHDLGKAAFRWKIDLAKGIAEHYYCHAMAAGKGAEKVVTFIGRPENIQALQMLYDWLIAQVQQIAREERRKHYDSTGEHIDPLRWQNNFGIGAVDRLITRLVELKARQTEDAEATGSNSTVTAMVLSRTSEISDWLEEQYGYRVDGKRTKRDQQWHDDWERNRQAKDEMKARCEESGDMEPYYTAYPYERPLTEKQQAELDRQYEKERKQRERNARRRKGDDRPGPSIDYVKEAQAGRARRSGQAGADRVNLQPFLTGQTDRKKVR